jgi:NAD(P)-dependent dehydrogenase (short-subunit alcohol dehydrogenase family)
MRRFADTGVVVTGGANGIGRVMSLAFAAEGATVVIWDIDELAAATVVAEIEGTGGRAVAITADVGRISDVERAFERTRAVDPAIQVLVNNAAVMIRAEFLDLLEQDWDTVMTTNLKSAFLCSQTVARHWVAQGIAGRIVNVSSVDAAVYHTHFPHYCVSKAGLRSLTRTTAVALAPFGIRVNEVAPGFTTPGMAAKVAAAPWWQERVESFVPLGRCGEAREVAAAALFLASDAATYITGAEIAVDGGHRLAAHDWILRQAVEWTDT